MGYLARIDILFLYFNFVTYKADSLNDFSMIKNFEFKGIKLTKKKREKKTLDKLDF